MTDKTGSPFGERHGPTPDEMRAENRLRLAHQARRAKEHQLDGIRRALCDIGFMRDDDPYSHADLEDVIRQAGGVDEVKAAVAADLDDDDLTGYTAPTPPLTKAEEARLAKSGVRTPGCTCGHEGMGVSWHDDDCPWRRGVLDVRPA